MTNKAQSARKHMKRLGKATSKAQSAMEYLMTYGWAILVIAVVLGVLYSLGIFNPSNFAPKAQPGSCQVFRPNGPGTVYDLNLAGTCSGELPAYTAVFNGQSHVTIPDSQAIRESTSMTYSMWINLRQSGTPWLFGKIDCPVTNGWYIYTDSAHGFAPTFVVYNSGTRYEWDSGYPIVQNNYYDIAITFDSGTAKLYLDGTPVSWSSQPSGSITIGTGTTPPMWLGSYMCGGYGFMGIVSNVQLYDSSLSQNQIYALYLEGIGGAPISLQSLSGWWPLNGNANDYSGNNDNGASANIVYTGAWQGEYKQP
jgi:hypothetical protein